MKRLLASPVRAWRKWEGFTTGQWSRIIGWIVVVESVAGLALSPSWTRPIFLLCLAWGALKAVTPPDMFDEREARKRAKREILGQVVAR